MSYTIYFRTDSSRPYERAIWRPQRLSEAIKYAREIHEEDESRDVIIRDTKSGSIVNRIGAE